MDHSFEIHRIETILGRPLDESEIAEVSFWRRGRALDQIKETEGVAVMLELLGGYADEASAALIAGKFAHDDELRTAHSQATAANEQYQKFRAEVQRMIEISRQTPEVVKQAFRQVGPAVEDA